MTRLNAFIGSLLLLVASQTFAGTVDNAQRMLNQLGYNAGPVDGAYGKKTRAALEAFYSENGRSYDGKLSQNEIVDLSKALNLNVVMVNKKPRGLGRLFYGPWNQDMPENAWAFNLTNIVPARDGELSQRFELRNGDCTTKYIPGDPHPQDWGCYNDRERAEVRHSMWKPGADKWIGFSIRVDNEWERHARGHCTSIFQIKQHENNVKQSKRPETKLGQYNKGHYIGGHAVMHGEICGDNFGVVIKHTGYEDSKLNGWSRPENVRYGKINNIAGEWNDVVLHWDTSDYRNGNSVLEVYLNGQLAGKWDNVTNNFFPDDYTFKYGLYRSYMKKHGVTSRTQVVYFDEVRTGRSFDAVNPATNGPLD